MIIRNICRDVAALRVLMQRYRCAGIRRCRVDRHEVMQGHANTAKPDSKAGRQASRQIRLCSGMFQSGHEARRPDGIEHKNSGHVERLDQRVPDGDRAAEPAIEVDRIIAGESRRPVFDQAFGMREAGFECQAIDQGLEGGTG